MLAPAQSPAFTSPELVIVVLVEGAKSAEPRTNPGSTEARAFSVRPEALRPDTDVPAGHEGRASSQLGGSWPAIVRSSSVARAGCRSRYARSVSAQAVRAWCRWRPLGPVAILASGRRERDIGVTGVTTHAALLGLPVADEGDVGVGHP